jgi:hypothetical protein
MELLKAISIVLKHVADYITTTLDSDLTKRQMRQGIQGLATTDGSEVTFLTRVDLKLRKLVEEYKTRDACW